MRSRAVSLLGGVVAMLIGPVLLSSCLDCPPGTVGKGCAEDMIQVTNISDEPTVIVLANPDGTRSEHRVPRSGSVFLPLADGQCLSGPIEVRAPGGAPGEAVGGELLGELDVACTGDQRTWRGDDQGDR